MVSRIRTRTTAVAKAALLVALMVLPRWALAAPRRSPERPRADARALFQRGSAAFREEHFDEAITLFGEAYALDPAPALLLNIAQAYRLKRPPDCVAAASHYERYLAAEPNAAERAEVEAYLEGMRSCIAAAEANERSRLPAAPPADTSPPLPPANTPAPPQPLQTPLPLPPAAPAPPPVRSTAALWTAGGGAALAAGGAALYVRARLKYDELEPTCPCPRDETDRWKTLTNVSYALMGIGSAVVVAGAAWWFWMPSTSAGGVARAPSSNAVPRLSLWAGTSGFGLSWSGGY